jgi:hypothetical protein
VTLILTCEASRTGDRVGDLRPDGGPRTLCPRALKVLQSTGFALGESMLLCNASHLHRNLADKIRKSETLQIVKTEMPNLIYQGIAGFYLHQGFDITRGTVSPSAYTDHEEHSPLT